jgi:hypothetical protein
MLRLLEHFSKQAQHITSKPYAWAVSGTTAQILLPAVEAQLVQRRLFVVQYLVNELLTHHILNLSATEVELTGQHGCIIVTKLTDH